jgi:hypothetical protein
MRFNIINNRIDFIGAVNIDNLNLIFIKIVLYYTIFHNNKSIYNIFF